METGQSANVKEYYRLITEIDIGLIAKELLAGRIVQESEKLLQCDCPNHASESHRSLHIMLDKQGWYCFGCGIGGDVLQLVEFVQSGQMTSGQHGAMPESHRQARDFLAEKAGIPPLSQYGLSPEEMAKTEERRSEEIRVHSVLLALAKFYHHRLKTFPQLLEWTQSKYGISEEMIDDLLIGFSDTEPRKSPGGTCLPGPVKTLTSEPHNFSFWDLASSGAFRPTNQDRLFPFFNKRIVFPYWSRGRVVFMIGRKTPWTPVNKYELGKYMKLPVHNEGRYKHVAPCIDNSHLYNEDCLLAGPHRIIITEGVTDCISLMQHGFPAVSPVTVRIREADWQRLLPELRTVKTVYICQDNEISEAGLNGALKTASILADHGIETKIVTLPLGDQQQEARTALKDQFGLDAGVAPKDLKEHLGGRPEGDIEEARELLSSAKIDVNEYFASGHTARDFDALLAEAQTPLHFGITSLPTDVSDEERNRLLEPILAAVSECSDLEQDRLIRVIQSRYGKSSLSLSTLRSQVSAAKKEKKKRDQERRQQRMLQSIAGRGTCRACVQEALALSIMTSGSPDYTLAAEAAFDWFVENGGRFFHTSSGEPYMFFQDEMTWMDSWERGKRRFYQSTIYDLTHVVHTAPGGRIFYEVLANLAVKKGKEQDHLSWLHTKIADRTVYFNLNNSEHEIAKITPEGIEIMKNGCNEDGVILRKSNKMKPLHYLDDVDLDEADRLVKELFLDNLTCSSCDALFILAWMSCFLLLDFAKTHPITRFEGPKGAAKSMASQLVSVILYGSEELKTSTVAANYADGARNPVIILDNIEVKQLTPELQQFMLTSATGVVKEKRKGGSDTETVVERVNCVVNTTGIEPLGGEFSELLSRTLIIQFDKKAHGKGCFLGAPLIDTLKEKRDLIVSAIMKRTSKVLAMLRDGAHEKVMRLLYEKIGEHEKERCNDYLSLMYLMLIINEDQSVIDCALENILPYFEDRITCLNNISAETARESNPIATALATLFKAYRHAVAADEESNADNVARTNKAVFLERYQIDFADENSIQGALARDLFVALKRVAREFALSFEMTSVQQFAQRFKNDLNTIREAGFQITVNRPDGAGNRTATYDIRLEPSEAKTQEIPSFAVL